MPTFSAEYLRRVGAMIFEAAGTPADIADEVSRSLVDANLAGHDSHGVLRIPSYLAMISPGQLKPAARPVVLKETATSVLIDGCQGFGQISGLFATDRVVDKALAAGIAIAGIIRCTHMGRVGEYAERAVARGCVAIVTVGGFGGRGAAAPYGGARPVFGTNPIAFGFGGKEVDPVIGDMATTMVAEGKLRVARAKGEPLPPGLILDAEGNPSTNVEDFYAGGMLLPFGGHKGSALALLVDLLGPALTGSAHYAEGAYPALGPTGTVIIAISNGVFRPPEEFAANVDRTIQRIKAVPPAPGFSEVLVAGEPERRNRAARLASGIPLPEATWEALRQAAAELNVTLPEAE